MGGDIIVSTSTIVSQYRLCMDFIAIEIIINYIIGYIPKVSRKESLVETCIVDRQNY